MVSGQPFGHGDSTRRQSSAVDCRSSVANTHFPAFAFAGLQLRTYVRPVSISVKLEYDHENEFDVKCSSSTTVDISDAWSIWV